MPSSSSSSSLLFLVAAALLAAWPVTAEPASASSSRKSKAAIYRFDLAYTNALPPVAAYEEALVVSALAGLVNRNASVLYVNYLPPDAYWWDYLDQRGYFEGVKDVIPLPDLDALLAALVPGTVTGAALYDPAVPATSNLACTAAGVYDALPIAFRPEDPSSLYSRHVLGGLRLPVLPGLDLVGRFNDAGGSITGSSKADAYLWAIEAFIVPGLVDPTLLAYFVDSFWTQVPTGSGMQGEAPSFDLNTVVNRDYFVARRGFFFDLGPWEDEAPIDDPTQPLGTDRKALEMILRACYEATEGRAMITVGGFTPWMFKYVGAKHEGVETEWETARLLSSYNALLDADACCVGAMANAAFYQHFPLPERHVQNPAPTPTELLALGYLLPDDAAPRGYRVNPDLAFYSFYVGDYDSAAWLYSQLPGKWDDPLRGSVPLGWALNPNLARRFPIAFDLVYRTLSPLDRVTTGDSGAGYVNPTELFAPRTSGLPDAREVWREWCLPHYQQFGLTQTGFLLNGKAGNMTREAQQFYSEFSWDGVTNHRGRSPAYPQVPSLEGNTPVFEEVDIPGGNVTGAAAVITGRYNGSGRGSQFMVFRSILQPPSYHVEVVDAVATLEPGLRVVDPLTLAYLARIHLGGHNDDRVAYIDDTLPRRAKPGAAVRDVAFTVRNNGFNALPLAAPSEEGAEQVMLRGSFARAADDGTVVAVFEVYGDEVEELAPGADGRLVAPEVLFPTTPGRYRLEYGLVRRWQGRQGQDFASVGNPRYAIDVEVTEK